jgi:hypothetical protein
MIDDLRLECSYRLQADDGSQSHAGSRGLELGLAGAVTGADDGVDQPFTRGVGGGVGEHDFAVGQHGDAVGDGVEPP